MKKSNIFKSWPFYCLIFPLVPIVYLASNTYTLVNPWNLVRPSLVLVFISVLLTSLLTLAFHDRHRAAILSCLLLLFFFFYRDLNSLISNIGLKKESWTQVLLLILIVFFIVLLRGKKESWSGTTRILNVVSCFVLLSFLVLVGLYRYSIPDILPIIEEADPLPHRSEVVSPQSEHPDIYFFLLDAYGRKDILNKYYNYNNEPFIKELHARGFIIPEKSRSNYNQTIPSLCSLLNMSNLEKAISSLPIHSYDRRPLVFVLTHNRLFNVLKNMGYKISVYNSGYGSTEMRSGVELIDDWRCLNNFESLLLFNTPLTKEANQWAYWSHVQRVKNSFSSVLNLVEIEKPRFYFFQIVCPHPPFVFEKDGNVKIPPNRFFGYSDGNHLVQNAELRNYYRHGYISQLTYINSQLLPVIDQLISRSKRSGRSLAIILQGDHGPGMWFHHESMELTNLEERFSIMNAYYFNGEFTKIPESITPANSFRVLMNYFFRSSLPLVMDRSFYIRWSFPYDLNRLTEKQFSGDSGM